MTKITREPAGETPDDSGSRKEGGRWRHLALVDAAIDEISYNQGRLEIQGGFRPNMLDSAASRAAQEVEA